MAYGSYDSDQVKLKDREIEAKNSRIWAGMILFAFVFSVNAGLVAGGQWNTDTAITSTILSIIAPTAVFFLVNRYS